MRLLLRLSTVSAGLSALGIAAIVLGGLCCPPAGFLAQLAPGAATAAGLGPSSSAAHLEGDC